MTGVDEQIAPRRGAPAGDHTDDAPVDDWGPPPWRSPWSRLIDRAAAPVLPWVTWFGPRRLIGGAVTIVLAVGVGWWLVRPAPPPTEARLPYAQTGTSSVAPGASVTPPVAATTSTSLLPPVIVVHVAGAVATPGIVELAGGSRIADALGPAGGALPDADLAAVNLATVLEDGQQIYVPTVGEARPPGPAPPPEAAGGTSAPTGPVDLNRASAVELDGLPGVGPATAAAIVAHRDANGPFATVDDLDAVRGIGPAKLDALRGLVTT